MIGPIECLVCGKPCVGLDGITAHRCDNLREQGWQVSAAHDEAVCPDCVRDVHEDTEESPAAPSFLTWRQLRDAVRVSGDEHTHEPKSETGNVPGVVAHLASMLNLDPREAERPITELNKLFKRTGPVVHGVPKCVGVACQCDEEAPNHHGGYGVCPKHGDFGDHLLVGDSVGGREWQGNDSDVHLVDGEPDSFQDADDDTWERQEDGSYRMPGPMGNYHHQPSLRAAVDYAGLQPEENLALGALQRERDVLEHKRHAEKQQARIHELEGQNIEMARRIEEQDRELAERIWELKHQTQRRREVERNQSVALDEQDERVRVLQDEIARVVAERNEAEKDAFQNRGWAEELRQQLDQME